MCRVPAPCALVILGTILIGCGQKTPNDPYAGYRAPSAYGTGGPNVPFKDNVATNTTVADGALDLSFKDQDGNAIELKQFRDKKNVLLVFMRGTTANGLCLFCTIQTSRLIANHADFARRDTQVLVVYPGDAKQLGTFLSNAKKEANAADKLPFQVLLDPDFKAVDRLEIRGDLAKPSTYILDKQGQVRFAYVGTSLTDRPSIKAMLAQLDAIGTVKKP